MRCGALYQSETMKAEILADGDDASLLITKTTNVDAVFKALGNRILATIKYVKQDQNDLAIFRFPESNHPNVHELKDDLESERFDVDVYGFTAPPRLP